MRYDNPHSGVGKVPPGTDTANHELNIYSPLLQRILPATKTKNDVLWIRQVVIDQIPLRIEFIWLRTIMEDRATAKA